MPFCSVEEALEDYRAGKFVIIVDDEHRENEGDLAMAAEKVTPEAINFMATYGRGLICMPMLGERLWDGLYGLGGPQARDYHRDFGVRPGRHRPGLNRPWLKA